MHAHLVVHRDLKPENIVLDSRHHIKINGRLLLCLVYCFCFLTFDLDFGLSCTITPGTRLKNFCGSPVYAAPEILRKKNYDGATADIWSLGNLLLLFVCSSILGLLI